MGNTNFQTIHQMGTAISDFVKQATGRGNVQNVVMDHVTVAQNHRYEEVDLSGQVVSFQAGEAGLTFEKLNVQIKPVQDLHGYDAPWPGGGGKNLFPLPTVANTKNGVTVEATSSGEIWVHGTPTIESGYLSFAIPPVSQSIIGQTATISINEKIAGIGVSSGALGGGLNITMSDTDTSRTALYGSVASDPAINVRYDVGMIDKKFKIQLEIGSSVTAWTPYSNICPITGWTMINVYQAGQNMEDARVYRFTFPSEAGTVYGGTLDVVTGVLTVDRKMDTLSNKSWTMETFGNNNVFLTNVISEKAKNYNFICNKYKHVNNYRNNLQNGEIGLYNNTTAANRFAICDNRFSAVENFVASISDLVVVYELATPITYHLTPQEITTLLGQNYIWADTGDIEVKFTNVKEMY